MPNRAFYCNKLTGGAANALDGIAGSTITLNDIAFVATTNYQSLLYRAVTSTAAESSPLIITPDAGSSSKRWFLMKSQGTINVTKTANYTVTTQDLQTGSLRFNNSGSTSTVTFSLPAGFTDACADFYVKSTYLLKVQANGAQKIRYKETLSSSGGYVQASTAGTFWQLAWNGSEWLVTFLSGTLTYNT